MKRQLSGNDTIEFHIIPWINAYDVWSRVWTSVVRFLIIAFESVFTRRHTGKEHKQSRRHKANTAQAESICPPGYPNQNRLTGSGRTNTLLVRGLLLYLSRLMTKPTKWYVRPARTQISLGIRPVWSESSPCPQWVAKDPGFLHADSEDSDQTERMPRLIWVFAGRTVILLVLSCRGSFYCGASWRSFWQMFVPLMSACILKLNILRHS